MRTTKALRPNRRFQLLLAITFGIPPDELYDRISHVDVLDLAKMWDEAPWGPEVDDVRSARLAYMTGLGKMKSTAKIKDFRLGIRSKVQRSPEQIQARLMAWSAAMGGKVAKKE